MLRLLVAFALGCFLLPGASAQCGTDDYASMSIFRTNLDHLRTPGRGVKNYIPVTFHILASSTGNGRVSEENLLLQVANLNAQYADQDIIFYLDELKYINNDLIYKTPGAWEAENQMFPYKDDNAVNIFICDKANDGTEQPGVTTLGYYTRSWDWIVMNKSQINYTANTLSHEVGHFLSLPHTFLGWECNPFNVAKYGNPVKFDNTLSCDGGWGEWEIELHDRSNCATAGDQICDTPEDYNLGLFFQPGCDSNRIVKDKNGELITPMINNVMSYYKGCDAFMFSPTQKQLILTDFLSGNRDYIRTGVVPNTDSVTAPVEYIYPINGEETHTTSGIVLDWEDTPGANQYLLTYARNAGFTISTVKLIVNESQFELPGELQEGSNYYWKVWPFNESRTDARYSATQHFVVGDLSDVNTIRDIESFLIYPNPVHSGETPYLSMHAVQPIDGHLEVLDMAGRILAGSSVAIPVGDSQTPVPVHDLLPGIYIIRLNTASGMLLSQVKVLE